MIDTQKIKIELERAEREDSMLERNIADAKRELETLKRKRDEHDRHIQELERLKAERADVERDMRELENKLRTFDQKRADYRRKIDTLERDIRSIHR